MSPYRACLSWRVTYSHLGRRQAFCLRTDALQISDPDTNARGFAPPGGQGFKLQAFPGRDTCSLSVPGTLNSEGRRESPAISGEPE